MGTVDERFQFFQMEHYTVASRLTPYDAHAYCACPSRGIRAARPQTIVPTVNARAVLIVLIDLSMDYPDRNGVRATPRSGRIEHGSAAEAFADMAPNADFGAAVRILCDAGIDAAADGKRDPEEAGRPTGLERVAVPLAIGQRYL